MYWNIETSLRRLSWLRLTLTWDVLKFRIIIFNSMVNTWLTLTWDVLKFVLFSFVCMINHD